MVSYGKVVRQAAEIIRARDSVRPNVCVKRAVARAFFARTFEQVTSDAGRSDSERRTQPAGPPEPRCRLAAGEPGWLSASVDELFDRLHSGRTTP